MNNIGLRISELRMSKRLTQKELADILGVSPSYVGQWESGARIVPTEKVVEIAKYFDVSTDYLFGHRSEKSDSTDLKDIIRNQTLSYKGEHLSERDITIIETFLNAVIDKEK